MPTPEELAAQQAAQGQSSAGTQNAEHMIPISRLNEVIAERQRLADRLAALETEKQSETEKRLAEQNQWKELAEKRAADLEAANSKAAKVEAYEKTLQDVLTASLAELPEEAQGLVPDELTTQQKLNWLAKHKALLMKPKAFDIGAGRQGGGQSTTTVELTPEEVQLAKSYGMTAEEYAKFK